MNLRIAVGSTKTFSEKTLPIIIPTLLSNGFNKDEIVIFDNGYEKRTVGSYEGIEHVKTDHNSIDQTALIELAEFDYPADYWFYTPDTCRMGPNFGELVRNIPEGMPEKVAARTFPSMSIGSYKYSYIKEEADYILAMKNTDISPVGVAKFKIVSFGLEDALLWKLDPHLTEVYNTHIPGVITTLEDDGAFGGAAKRIIEHLHSLDIYKYKANWGQGGYPVVVL